MNINKIVEFLGGFIVITLIGLALLAVISNILGIPEKHKQKHQKAIQILQNHGQQISTNVFLFEGDYFKIEENKVFLYVTNFVEFNEF